MATSDDGCSFIEMDDEGCKASVGQPSYKDLLDENKYLRSVLSKLYEQAALTSTDVSRKAQTDLISGTQQSAEAPSEECYQHKNLVTSYYVQELELRHLQAHCIEQAAALKAYCQKLEEVECELNLANVEILQILPLRMKLTESNKKLDVLRGEVLVANNENADRSSEKIQLLVQLDMSRQRYEDLRHTLEDRQEHYAASKLEISGLLEQIAILERTLTDKSNNLKSQEVHVKQLDDMIGSLRTDCAHWERKSTSASKEIARLHANHQAQLMAQQTDLKDKYSAIKVKLKLREETIKSLLKQSLAIRTGQLKQARCVAMRACITAPKKSPRSLSANDKARTGAVQSNLNSRKKSTSEKSRGMTVDVSKAEMKAIELTCDSIDEGTNDIEDKEDNVETNCICAGLSFLTRRKAKK